MDYGEGLSRLTYATKRLEDLNKACQIPDALAESLFGEKSDYASTSGKGSETKMFNGHSCISPWQYNHVIQRS